MKNKTLLVMVVHLFFPRLSQIMSLYVGASRRLKDLAHFLVGSSSIAWKIVGHSAWLRNYLASVTLEKVTKQTPWLQLVCFWNSALVCSSMF